VRLVRFALLERGKRKTKKTRGNKSVGVKSKSSPVNPPRRSRGGSWLRKPVVLLRFEQECFGSLFTGAPSRGLFDFGGLALPQLGQMAVCIGGLLVNGCSELVYKAWTSRCPGAASEGAQPFIPCRPESSSRRQHSRVRVVPAEGTSSHASCCLFCGSRDNGRG
jgi:hypothetical protein